ncbi:sigma factor-like helix-turn-helix DNA-binding protein [Oceanirhabdus seepicola]|uniref:RNA polymerase sigma factor 70 region 4 type 2 domain-containing protein n=1 Tax=Oceanirhabdus seepicola TaxID=2828781 RepID=A0A9J6P785_9CLOT|nr:hypothetical protein [Oceanirhabdus seepicola]
MGIKIISYIKQMITYGVIDYYNKKAKLETKEMLSLNTKADDFEQEKIDLIEGNDGEFINKIIIPSSDKVDFNCLCIDEMILKAIDRLSDRQKEIIYRAVVLNQSEKELARELNISPLKGLTKLNNLDLRSNQITDFSPLEGLKISNLKK